MVDSNTQEISLLANGGGPNGALHPRATLESDLCIDRGLTCHLSAHARGSRRSVRQGRTSFARSDAVGAGEKIRSERARLGAISALHLARGAFRFRRAISEPNRNRD